MKNKRKRLNKRGIAVEMAISMLIIVFGLCTILTSVTVLSANTTRRASARFEDTAAVDALGEKFVREGTVTSDEFDCAISEDGNTLTVSRDGTVLLTVERSATNPPTVVRWIH